MVPSENFCLRLLFLDDPISVEVVEKFVVAGARGKAAHREAVRWLDDLRIWQRTEAGIALNPQFRAGLRPVLAGGSTPWIGSDEKKGGYGDRRDADKLEEWGIARWETVLYVMVGHGGGE